MEHEVSQKSESAQAAGAGVSILAIVGSLRFAGLLIMLLLVGMACATIFESSNGTERAMAMFYGAWWFKALLALLGVSILASLALRLPVTRRNAGFVLTHGGLLAIMVGAVITMVWGIDGQVAVVEGQTVKSFQDRHNVLTVLNRSDQSTVSVDLASAAFHGFVAIDRPKAPVLSKDEMSVEVLRYLPDSAAVERVVDDNPRRQPAVEVSFGPAGAAPQWVFSDHPASFGDSAVAYRMAAGDDELQALLADSPSADSASVGRIKVAIAGEVYELAVEQCTEAPASIGETDHSIRVLRYLPHATVGSDRQIVSASDRPVNPAVEVELTSPAGAERRVSFAKFPDFQSMHGRTAHADVTVTFVANAAAEASAPIEIVGAPDGRMFVKFAQAGARARAQALRLGEALETPWTGRQLTAHRRFENARIDRPLEAVEPVREKRMPAILVKLRKGEQTSEMWVQRGYSRPVSVDGTPYEIGYGDRSIPLGFNLRLNGFKIVRYPGGHSPRSFESNITIVDPATGDTRERIVSMNHPIKHGGYTLYQSSYVGEGRGATSVFSVSRDPGQSIVFAGYILTILGMIVVLLDRVRVQRLLAEAIKHKSDEATKRRSDEGTRATGVASKSRQASLVSRCLALGLLLSATAGTRAAELPQSVDVAGLRGVVVQSDGRWPPLDTVARDVVESVTGDPVHQGHDPVRMLLGWTFDPQVWMSEPLIPIRNAELRRELKLDAMRTSFSYAELVRHRPLTALIEALSNRPAGGKLDPLESKVSGIHEKLNTLHTAFGGHLINPVPDPRDATARWTSMAEVLADRSPQHQGVRDAWAALRTAFVADDAAAFATATDAFTTALAGLPAAYRPASAKIVIELRSNRLHPFRTSWQIMAAGAVLAAFALFMRRRVFDVIAVVALLAGFALLTYGLYLRWQIAGRIPAANMFESLLFLSWGMGAFAILSLLVMRDRVVPLTASAMGALALFLADVLPLDSYIRPITPVLQDTVWMSIHVPVIMVSYSVLALAMLIAHAQIVVMAAAPQRRRLIGTIERMHYWYVHVGSILLLVGIATGSMWAASSWGRYWGWDPKEVWSLVALLAYLAILHARVDRQALPAWTWGLVAALLAALMLLIASKLAPITPAKAAALLGAAGMVVFFIAVRGEFTTALKSIIAFWTIIMTYVGVNYVLGTGLHSYGFGTGAVVYYLKLVGGTDLGFALVCAMAYALRSRLVSARAGVPVRPAVSA